MGMASASSGVVPIERLFSEYVAEARAIFEAKGKKYGASWLAFRLPSLLDQLMIKARRIRTIQQRGTQQVEDPLREEYLAIINYAVLGLIRLHMSPDEEAAFEADPSQVGPLYGKYVDEAFRTMRRKNHDYGEAWREMFEESFADMILAKLMRMKTMLADRTNNAPVASIHDNLIDIINYAVFALTKMDGHA